MGCVWISWQSKCVSKHTPLTRYRAPTQTQTHLHPQNHNWLTATQLSLTFLQTPLLLKAPTETKVMNGSVNSCRCGGHSQLTKSEALAYSHTVTEMMRLKVFCFLYSICWNLTLHGSICHFRDLGQMQPEDVFHQLHQEIQDVFLAVKYTFKSFSLLVNPCTKLVINSCHSNCLFV